MVPLLPVKRGSSRECVSERGERKGGYVTYRLGGRQESHHKVAVVFIGGFPTRKKEGEIPLRRDPFQRITVEGKHGYIQEKKDTVLA